MKYKYIFITIGIILLAGIVLAIGETWTNTNKTLNIQCIENQKIFGCKCSPEPKMKYYITNTWQEDKILYVNYTGKMWMGTCVQGKKESTLTYTGEFDEEIQNDMMTWLTIEYNERNIKEIKVEPTSGGTINVIP